MKKMNIVLGTMTFGESVFDADVSEFIKTFINLGYNELDAAYVYNDGACENMLGSILPSLARPFKVASKSNPRITGKLDDKAVLDQTRQSLERLKLDCVDIEYLHFPDPATPLELPVKAMDELYKEGKIKEFGVSNFPIDMMDEVFSICEKNGYIKPTVYQGKYNPLTRKAEESLDEYLTKHGMRFYAYNPLAGGLLTGRYEHFEDAPSDGRFTHRPGYQGRYWKKSYFDAIAIIKNACDKNGISIIEATYRWLANHSMLKKQRGDAIIIGASKLSHLEQNIKAIEGGELPDDIKTAFEKAWEMTKADSPDYYTIYKKK